MLAGSSSSAQAVPQAEAPSGGSVVPKRRKPFAQPPVKAACLGCRAARVRCAGLNPCPRCVSRQLDCEYTQSKRGGLRIPGQRKVAPQQPLATLEQIADLSRPGFGLMALDEGPRDLELSPSPSPGAFTAASASPPLAFSLPWDSSSDNLDSDLSGPSSKSQSPLLSPVPWCRTYSSDADILSAYYCWIHPFFPILPPPLSWPCVDRPEARVRNANESFTPSSPLALAILAIVVIIAHPDDPYPEEPASVIFRREVSQGYANSCIEAIDSGAELLLSFLNPAEALSVSSTVNFPRKISFAPNVPTELEEVIALTLCAVYSYVQRGNIQQMRRRSGQALAAAIELGLHGGDGEDGPMAESRRRAWWMTWLISHQSAIVGNTKAAWAIDAVYARKYPSIIADSDVWSFFLGSQRAIAHANRALVDLRTAEESGGNTALVYSQMVQLDAVLASMLPLADGRCPTQASTLPVDQTELVVSQALRAIARIKICSARIKLHRFQAFKDLPVFTRRHCDIKSAAEAASTVSSPPGALCGCSSLPTPSDVDMNRSIPTSDPTYPFDKASSTAICRERGLAIAASFAALPLPNPTGAVLAPGEPAYLSDTSNILAPRTMPAFACCAMQCSYSLLMLSFGSVLEGFHQGAADSTTEQLQAGLESILHTLENFAQSSEALGGMYADVLNASNQFSGVSTSWM